MALSDAAASAVAAWALDEASGTRVDQVGTNDLTDNNTVASGTGMFGNAADFELDNSEYLNVADSTDLSMGDVDMTISCWIKIESAPGGAGMVVARKDDLSTNREWGMYLDSAGTPYFYVFGSSGGGDFTQVPWGSSLSTATWYLLVGKHDSTNNIIGISVNGGSFATTAHTLGIYDGTADFVVGGSAEAANDFDGLIDDLAVVKNYCMTDGDVSDLYNSGAGVAFADWAAAAGHPAMRRVGLCQYMRPVGIGQEGVLVA